MKSDCILRKVVARFDPESDTTLIKTDTMRKLKNKRQSRKFTFGRARGGYCFADTALVFLWMRRYDQTVKVQHNCWRAQKTCSQKL